MSTPSWRDPLAADAGARWRTLSPERTVLVIVHNVTAATRLLDMFPLWAHDTRIHTVFTCIGSSAFTEGTDGFLNGRGITPLPWDDAIKIDADLAVSASYGGPLNEIPFPLLVIPHGMGYNKFLQKPETRNQKPETRNQKPETRNQKPETRNQKPETRNQKPVFGLDPAWLLHDGALVPSIAVLSHSEQRERLRKYCPEAVPAALVAGDPCFDRMLASVALREVYRERFSARPAQRVVVVSSTWGHASLFGCNPSLILRLARELPLDEYRVLVALHPNIWYGHSSWQIRMWLRECEKAGVTLLPPEDGWRAALVAADITIGDHGSVTFYSAALGTPVLMAAWPEETVDPASPIAHLLRCAPRLDEHKDLAAQLEETIGDHHPARYADITSLTTSCPGESAIRLRSAIYEQIAIAEPETPAEELALPLPPAVAGTNHHSQLIDVHLNPREPASASVSRLPAAALHDPAKVPGAAVLAVSSDEPHRRWLELADIVILDDRYEDPVRVCREVLAKLPGCLLGAGLTIGGEWVVSGSDVPAVCFDGPDDLGGVYAALVHAWLRDGRPLSEFPGVIQLQLGPRQETVYASVS